MTYVYPKTRFYSVPTWWKPLSVFSFLEWIFMYKTAEMKFSFDRIYETIHSTIPAYRGGIVEQNKNITEIYIPKGLYID
ncbi:hypothetical protein N9V60_00155 [Flavobacteriaceae bacterium]|nr:hypothetical protein [Flavobacteriaceae bacterium]